jgi:hypothetical protein
MMTHDPESQHSVATFVVTNVSGELTALFFSVQYKNFSCLATVTKLRLITEDRNRIKTVSTQRKSRIEDNVYR